MWTALGILLGCAAGGVARLWVSRVLARVAGEALPWGTLAVNVSGAALIGAAAGWLGTPDGTAPDVAWAVAVVGFLGSYTTVSSFSLQTLLLAQGRRWGAAAANVAVSVIACLGAATAGLWLTLALTSP